MKTAIDTIKNHRTYRHFKKNHPIKNEDLQTIIECAQQAPSWMNGQHYSIIHISSSDLLKKITELQPNNPQIGTCSIFLVFVANLHRAELCSQAYGGSFEASGHSDNLITAVTDTALAAQNAVIAAESLDYATCFIGGIRFIATQIIELLNLPKHTFPIMGLCIGIPDIQMDLKPRLPKNTIYSENAYPDTTILSDGLSQYEQTMIEFAEERETLPYREKFSRYYSSNIPKNEPLIYQQGWLIHDKSKKI